MQRDITGSKYEEVRGMDIKDIAKLIREDLKADYIGSQYKFSVQIERYSMGRSVNIVVKNTGLDDIHGAAANQIRSAVRRITDQYNYDRSDIMTDYFSVNFYSNVRVER